MDKPEQGLSRRSIVGLLLVLSLALLSVSSCSPGYVLRAGWEEAGILWRRQEISSVIADAAVNDLTRTKLTLVLQARDFAKEIGLKPDESFTTYSAIDRDELLWVLSAAEKTRFRAKTWWFPIVGSVPYKGFFEEADARAEAKELEDEGLDIHLRPSPAFSTLGWFNDPLLSTTLRSDEMTLVNTVIHEILHNTIWIKNNVPFNESLANFIGNRGAILFFEKQFSADHKWAVEARARWERELRYADFLEQLKVELTPLYDTVWSPGGKLAESLSAADLDRVLAERDRIFADAVARFFPPAPAAPGQPAPKRKIPPKMNNALIMAQQVYLTKPRLFEQLAGCEHQELSKVVERVKELAERANDAGKDPFEILAADVAQCSVTTPAEAASQ